jgi:hypothetical protein
MANALQVTAALADRHCACEPYADVFTFGRWRAQGRTVRRGEHGIRLTVYIAARRHDAIDDASGTEAGQAQPDAIRRYPRVSFVFCRCQTDALEARP